MLTIARPIRTLMQVVLGILGGVAALALLVAGYIFWSSGYLSGRPFDSARWKDPQQADQRVYMIDSLVRTHELKGLAKADILAMLGAPRKSDYFTAWDYVYWMGP